MAQFDTEVNMLLVLGECRNNYREASNVFRQRYGVEKSHMAFHRLERRVRTTGSVISRTRNRVKQIINEDNKVNILAAVNRNPHISQRQLERESNISRTSIRRLLKTEKFHPYHLVLHQELLPTDYDQRIRFCAWMRRAIEENNNFLFNVLFSDESTFTNCGQVNRHNLHYWSPENPYWMHTVPFQHRWSLNVWCGIVGDSVIGPYFFEDTVTSQSYCNFLSNELHVLLEDVPLCIRRDMWFQHDGAPPHFARITRTLLNKMFGQRWIGRGGLIQWPARSPDLTPLDFFLWGYIKEKVFSTVPTTREELKERIRTACASITPAMLFSVRRNIIERLLKCLEVHGMLFEHLLK